MQLSRGVSIAVIVALLSSAQLRAQQPQLPTAGPGIIAGLVTDTASRPVEGASVWLQERSREVRTGPDGVFRFQGLNMKDTLTVVVRRIGFFPLSARVPLGEEGRQVVVQLRPRLTSLPAVITEITLTGISGVVTDSQLRPIPDAQVEAMGAVGGIVRTDSMGVFSLKANPGSYMLRVSQTGFVGEVLGVTVPPRGGRRVAVRLVPGRDPYRNREAFTFGNMRDRLLRTSSANSRTFTREDIAKLNPRDVAELSRRGVRGRTDDDCEATINGIYGSVPLWSIDPDEIEFMEVHGRPIDMGQVRAGRGITSINGNTRIRGQLGARGRITGAEKCPMGGIYIWTTQR